MTDVSGKNSIKWATSTTTTATGASDVTPLLQISRVCGAKRETKKGGGGGWIWSGISKFDKDLERKTSWGARDYYSWQKYEGLETKQAGYHLAKNFYWKEFEIRSSNVRCSDVRCSDVKCSDVRCLDFRSLKVRSSNERI